MASSTKKPGAMSRVAAAAPADAEVLVAPIVERPDGFYWQSVDGKQEFGPFESFEMAREARDADSEETIAPGETLHAVEDEIGIASWIDAETGAPAEGSSPPHLPAD
jgi:hypothetical protein